MLERRLWWVSGTPLGSPEEPEVNISTASSAPVGASSPSFFNHEPRCQEFDGEAPAFGGTFKQGNFPLHEDQIPLGGPREILELSHEGIRSNKPVHAGLLYRAGKGSFRGGIIEIHRCFPGEQAAQIGYGRSLARRKNDADPAIRGNFFQPLGKGYGNGQ